MEFPTKVRKNVSWGQNHKLSFPVYDSTNKKLNDF